MNRASLREWLALREVQGLDDGTRCRLVQALGSPEAVLGASVKALQEAGLSPSQAGMVRRKPDPERQQGIERELKELDRVRPSVITILDAGYPSRLRTIPDPPLFFYLTGTLQSSDDLALAIVGSRQATQSGRLLTERLSRELASVGFTIVSGLARGVDAAAHRGALEAGGRTLAVQGCGIDRTYPSEHQALRRQIEASGGVLSELPLGAYPHAYHFPRRNRLISGLSLGVLVTEAAARSGSLITARLAGEQGREVFAVPGPVRQEQSRGPHGLIKQGAKLVETIRDVIDELLPQLDGSMRERLERHQGPGAPSEAAPRLEGQEALVYSLLSDQATQVDDLIAKSGLPAATVNSLLLSLELKGLIRRLPGSCSARV